MYEKPQYFTPYGLIRKKKNPSGKIALRPKVPGAPGQNSGVLPARKAIPQKQLSEKAAKLIAEALRAMLRE